jgi:hypothetical protein
MFYFIFYILTPVLQDPDPNVQAPPNRVRAMIGYHLAWEHNIIGMAMTQGRQRDVVYMGMAIKRLQVEPRDATILAYAQSFYHKASDLYLWKFILNFSAVDRVRNLVRRSRKR